MAASSLLLLCLFSVVVRLTVAEIYKVGDSAGWNIGSTNYTTWASTKSFHVGDTIVFQYNKQFHNVLQVSKADYHDCNGVSPIATHTSGNDSISINKHGHYFFICGFPGHCGLGQRVGIRIIEDDFPVTPEAPAPSPAPGPSNGKSNLKGIGLALIAVVAVVISTVIMS